MVIIRYILLALIFATPLPALAQFKLPIEVEGPMQVEINETQADKEKAEHQREEDRQHDMSDLQAQWLAAKSADRMVWLGYFQLALTFLTLIAAGYSIKISRDTFISENRPVMVSETPAFPAGLLANADPIPFSWRVINQGRGVGFVRSYRIWLSTADTAQEALSTSGPTITRDRMHWPIAATQWWGITEHPVPAFSVEMRQRIMMDIEKAYFYGEITYLGTGNKVYQMRCAFEYNSNTGTFGSHADDAWWV